MSKYMSVTGLPSAVRRCVVSATLRRPGERGRQRRVAGFRAVLRSEDCERAVADQLEHVAGVLMDRWNDCIGVE
jgi:hypothetical protein